MSQKQEEVYHHNEVVYEQIAISGSHVTGTGKVCHMIYTVQ